MRGLRLDGWKTEAEPDSFPVANDWRDSLLSETPRVREGGRQDDQAPQRMRAQRSMAGSVVRSPHPSV